MNYKKMKDQAKKNLKGNYSTLVLATLILFSIGAVCNFIGNVTDSMFLTYALSLIADSLLAMGFVKMIVKVSNKKKAELADLTSETDLFLKYMAISVIVFVIVGILILLALIAFKSLCMVIANMGAINLLLGTVLILCGLLLITLIIGVTVYMSIAFSQSLFILYEEKDLPATKVLSKSFDMMDGYTLEYLILTLTFIGWFVLCVVTLGIGYIFLAPYLLVVYANFYKVVKKDYKTAKGDKKPEKIFNDEDTKAEEE